MEIQQNSNNPKKPEFLNITSRDPKFIDLSNLSNTPFCMRGAHFASVEAFLQYIKYPNRLCTEAQINRFCDSQFTKLNPEQFLTNVEAIPSLYGVKSKKAGALANELIEFNARRKLPNFVYWQGQEYPYRSPQHLGLIKTAIEYKFLQNAGLTALLCSTGDTPLVHDLGSAESKLTSLRDTEFTGILEQIRRDNKNLYWHSASF